MCITVVPAANLISGKALEIREATVFEIEPGPKYIMYTYILLQAYTVGCANIFSLVEIKDLLPACSYQVRSQMK